MSSIAEIVTPVFGVVALSFVLSRRGLFPPSTSEGMSRFMLYAAVPALLFRTLAEADLPAQLPWEFIAAFYGSSLTLFIAGILIMRRFFRWERRADGIAGISASYSNMIMLGMPLTLATFGDRAAVPLFILLALQSTILFPLTSFTLDLARKQDGHHNHPLAGVAKLLLNPVILGLALGITANITETTITGSLAAIIELLSAAAPACALVALGAGLAQYKLGGRHGEALAFAALKGLLHPFLVWMTCTLAGVPTLWMQVAVLLAAMPIGINSFIFAQAYECRPEVVSKAIVISTVASTVTISILIAAFLHG